MKSQSPAARKAATAVPRKPAAKKPVARKPANVVVVANPKIADVASAAPTPAAKPAPSRKRSTAKAVSPIVRDSFTMTTADQELLKKCKREAIMAGRDSTKKSEIVRAALRHFASLSPSTQLMEINGLDPVKTGRPKKK
jgi:hypothetical protein